MRCKICNEKFEQKYFLQKTCSKECESEFLKSKPIKKLSQKSQKRKMQEKTYKDLRRVYLNKNPICEANNSHKSTEIHHINGRNGDRLNDTSEFMAVCRDCHRWIHENPKKARLLGWLK